MHNKVSSKADSTRLLELLGKVYEREAKIKAKEPVVERAVLPTGYDETPTKHITFAEQIRDLAERALVANGDELRTLRTQLRTRLRNKALDVADYRSLHDLLRRVNQRE